MDPEADPFLLDWGSSLNVNEDLRRTIQSEISAIDKEIQSLDDSVRKEQKVSTQSRRDFSYAQAELVQLARGAGDDEDNAAMNEQIQMRLSDTLQNEIIPVVSSSRDSSENQTPVLDDSDSSNESSFMSHIRGSRPDTLDAGMPDIAKRARDVRQLKHAIQAKNELFEACKSKAAEEKYKLDFIKARLVREQKNQVAWNEDREVKRRENESEKMRFRSAKESLYKARKITAEHTEQRTKYLNQLTCNKRTNNAKEIDLSSMLKFSESNNSDLSEQVSTLSRLVTHKSDRLDQLQKQQVEREDFCSQCQVTQEDIKKRTSTLRSLKVQREEVVNMLCEAQKVFDLSSDKLIVIEKIKADLDRVFILGQKEGAEVIEPARIELPKLLKESEDLARLIASYREKQSSLKMSGDSNLSSMKEILDGVRNQVKSKSDEEKEKEKRLSTLQTTWEDNKLIALQDIEQQNKLRCKFEEASNIELGVIESLEERLMRETFEKKEARKHEYISEVVKRDMLSCGADIIKETERLENDQENLEIVA